MLAHQTVLVTGFGPFPGADVNPSGAAARAIHGERVGSVAFVGHQVATSWTQAWPAIKGHVLATRPSALIMLGVARDRARICVERVARNVMSQRPDCDGALPGACEPGPFERATSLPWQALCGPERHAAPSDDAGDYLCNYVFYRAMAELDVPLRGFVHIPDGPIEPVLAFLRDFVRVV